VLPECEGGKSVRKKDEGEGRGEEVWKGKGKGWGRKIR